MRTPVIDTDNQVSFACCHPERSEANRGTPMAASYPAGTYLGGSAVQSGCRKRLLFVVIRWSEAKSRNPDGRQLSERRSYLGGTAVESRGLPGLSAGGIIGGLGCVLSISTCYGRLLSPDYLFRGAGVGAVSALAFGPWLVSFYLHIGSPVDPLQPSLLFAFAVWQAAVGTYLYSICTGNDEETST